MCVQIHIHSYITIQYVFVNPFLKIFFKMT